MLYIRDKDFNDANYDKYFHEFTDFTLSNFQKWSIKAIVDGDHAFVSAPTGSGKTLPAEFIIHHCLQSSINRPQKRKKIIYASPIKALSNQKLHDMRLRFPNLSVGLLTGDHKDNPEADILIMTTEILRNTLFNQKMKVINQDTSNNKLAFNIDIHTELAAVIFDEVHYIGDPERGSVWEQSIIMIPDTVQLVLLSATIDKPIDFANWIHSLTCSTLKNVYFIPTTHRIVPLTHYLWLNCNESTEKKIKDPSIKKDITDLTNLPILIKDNQKPFYDTNYFRISKLQSFLYKNYLVPAHKQCLNKLILYLKNNKMIPALCFCFSRKLVESYASTITINLHDDNGLCASNVENECRAILKSKLINYQEYLNLPDYIKLIELLKKGVGIHHAGMLSVMRELIEMLFTKGYIKVLFATETFSVGINMPTKTVIFSSLYKFDGHEHRLLKPHEYLQMSGRAGRRGIDTQGHVIHCNSLFTPPPSIEYKYLLTGPSQSISSKFHVSYNFMLNILSSNKLTADDVVHFVDKSLLHKDIQHDITYYETALEKLEHKIETQKTIIETLSTPKHILEDYIELKKQLNNSKNKKRKHLSNQIDNISSNHPTITNDITSFNQLTLLENDLDYNQLLLNKAINYVKNGVIKITDMLQSINFIIINDNTFSLTRHGLFASQIMEANPIILSTIISKQDLFNNLYPMEIASLLSCFTDISTPDDMKVFRPNSTSNTLNAACLEIQDSIEDIKNREYHCLIITNDAYNIHYDCLSLVLDWCFAETDKQCQCILDRAKDFSISTGDFIKCILKISNIVSELSSSAELIGNIDLLEKLRSIPPYLLKYVATHQSLYV